MTFHIPFSKRRRGLCPKKFFPSARVQSEAGIGERKVRLKEPSSWGPCNSSRLKNNPPLKRSQTDEWGPEQGPKKDQKTYGEGRKSRKSRLRPKQLLLSIDRPVDPVGKLEIDQLLYERRQVGRFTKGEGPEKKIEFDTQKNAREGTGLSGLLKMNLFNRAK